MILCYPAPGETMWSIAKRYGVAASALEAANRDAGRVVVIPRGGISGVV
jgi:LysM repeat protein